MVKILLFFLGKKMSFTEIHQQDAEKYAANLQKIPFGYKTHGSLENHTDTMNLENVANLCKNKKIEQMLIGESIILLSWGQSTLLKITRMDLDIYQIQKVTCKKEYRLELSMTPLFISLLGLCIINMSIDLLLNIRSFPCVPCVSVMYWSYNVLNFRFRDISLYNMFANLT